MIARCQSNQIDAWFQLRRGLWPDEDHAKMRTDCEPMLASADTAVFVAMNDDALIGFAEVSLRRDYVNGCETSPVAFLEGIYVDPAHRRKGLSQALVGAAEVGDVKKAAANSPPMR